MLRRLTGIRVGAVTVLACQNKHILSHYAARLLAHSYQPCLTAHFVICRSSSSRRAFVLHTFGQQMIDADLIYFVEHELAPLGLITTAQEYASLLYALLASVMPSPRHQQNTWRRFCLNTLTRYHTLLSQPSQLVSPDAGHVEVFAAIYRRILELCVGERLLDIGTSFGFFPVLAAKYKPGIQIVACDNNPTMLTIAGDLIAVTETPGVTLLFQDILDERFARLGQFETVAAIHVLEHFREEELPPALMHLLRVTLRRLIIVVPYEEEVQHLYGHRQQFTQEKLERWGEWCVEYLGGQARYWCEDIMGGLLVVDCL
jgi:SAM-dependent methyltransferase